MFRKLSTIFAVSSAYRISSADGQNFVPENELPIVVPTLALGPGELDLAADPFTIFPTNQSFNSDFKLETTEALSTIDALSEVNVTNQPPTQTTTIEEECSITNALAGGIPDIPITGGWSHFILSGTTKSGITQHDTKFDQALFITERSSVQKQYFLGRYSHTSGAVSYYTNGDSLYCGRPRTSQVTWKCGNRHLEVVSASEPAICEYHLEIEINCCLPLDTDAETNSLELGSGDLGNSSDIDETARTTTVGDLTASLTTALTTPTTTPLWWQDSVLNWPRRFWGWCGTFG